jgi:hypothetical protein
MALTLRRAPHAPTRPAARPAAAGNQPADRSPGGTVVAVQRGGALVVAAVLLVFGVLGFAGGLDYFSTEGEPILGMPSNGLLSTISVVTAAVLVIAAARSARTVSTVMIGVGTAFLLSALVNLAVLETDWNLLAFSMANVVFSLAAGLVLLTLGAYGRITGNVPADSPYHRPHPSGMDADVDQQLPRTGVELAAESAMREAELAVVEHRATPDQQRRVAAMARVRTRADRRDVWMSFDRSPA